MTDDLRDLHRDFGALEQQVKNLTAEVSALRTCVAELTALLNQAKGAKLAIFVVPAIISATVGTLAYFGLKLTFGSPV